MTLTKPILLASAALIGLAACTQPDGSPDRTATAAIVGGAAGAALGNVLDSNRTRGTIIGAAAGTVIGGAIGQQLDAQARALERELGGTGATVVNTGENLVVTLPEAITFDFDSAVVRPQFRSSLANVARNLREFPNNTVQVIGYTDNVGTATYNQGLSERRANAVRDVLVAEGVQPWRISAIGRGATNFVASNDTAAGRAQNRRVEIIIIPTT